MPQISQSGIRSLQQVIFLENSLKKDIAAIKLLIRVLVEANFC